MTSVTGCEAQTFPMRRRCPFAPPPEYAQLLAEQPVTRVRLAATGGLAWLVTRHADVRGALTDSRFSADSGRPGFPQVVPFPADAPREQRPFLHMDPPEHTGYRRMLIPEFTVKRIKAMRPAIQSIVDARIAGLLATPRPADLVAKLALPVPSLVICDLLGVPYADHEFFESRSVVVLSTASTTEQIATAQFELIDYLDELIGRKQREPADDLLSRLVSGYLATGQISRANLVTSMLLLLTAGHETTSNMISLGTAALLAHPEQLALLRADPALVPGAVEELLRLLSVADFVPARVATEDVEIAGTRVRAGEGIITALAAANRDPAVFPRADEFDVRRGSRQHLAFGFGVHQCLGQNLARLELEIVFSTLFRRIPTLRLAAPLDELSCKHDGSLFGLNELPVTW